MTAATQDLTSVVRRIGSVFERAYAPDAIRPTWTEVERLLGDGYAQALRMDSERKQIERRVTKLVATPAEREVTHELRALSARYGEVDRNLRWLRSLLEELRDYGLALRGNGGPEQEAAEQLDG